MTRLPLPGPRDSARILRARRAGIVNPLIAWQEAKLLGLPFALLCAVLDQETGGGHNVFGHDPTICVGAGAVTKAKYLAYREARGTTHMQGVGPMQLTWWSTQDKADALGGCWLPRCNIRVGAGALSYNVTRYGLDAGVAAYNGSGVAATNYATRVIARYDKWKRILQ